MPPLSSTEMLLSGGALVPALVCALSDVQQQRIPNRVLLPAGGAMLLLSPWYPGRPWWSGWVGGLVAGVVMGLLLELGQRLYGQPVMGYGDLKLAAYLGLVVGYPTVWLALFWTMLSNGLVLAYYALHGARGAARLPLAPALVAGAIISLVCGG